MNELALFAGAGGGLLATHHLLGWRCIGYVEMAEYPCKVLERRIEDGLLSKAPIYQMHTRDFIQSGIAEKYRGLVDVITAGFPCQPFSSAGKGLADQDERNGWPDTLRIINIVKPRYVFLENVSRLLTGSHGYFGEILKDLAASRYAAQWDCIPASALGANHQRDRLWIVAYADRTKMAVRGPHRTIEAFGRDGAHVDRRSRSDDRRESDSRSNGQMADSDEGQQQLHQSSRQRETRGQDDANGSGQEVSDAASLTKREPANKAKPKPISGQARQISSGGSWWATEPPLGRVVDGLADWLDLVEAPTPAKAGRMAVSLWNGEIKALGNGQVPIQAKTAWELLTSE